MTEYGGYYFDVSAYRHSDQVRLMDHETRGIYREVLDEIWVTGSVPNNPELIARLIHVPTEAVIKAWPQIQDCLTEVRNEPTRLTSERMEQERKYRNQIRKERRKSGLLGGKASAEQRRRKAEAFASANSNRTSTTPTPIPTPIPTPTPTKESKTQTSAAPSALELGFREFWSLYPKKKGRVAAIKAWYKVAPQNGMREIILAAVRKQNQWPEWLKDNGQYIPHPATWLNRGQWDDEEYRNEERSKAIHDLLK